MLRLRGMLMMLARWVGVGCGSARPTSRLRRISASDRVGVGVGGVGAGGIGVAVLLLDERLRAPGYMCCCLFRRPIGLMFRRGGDGGDGGDGGGLRRMNRLGPQGSRIPCCRCRRPRRSCWTGSWMIGVMGRWRRCCGLLATRGGMATACCRTRDRAVFGCGRRGSRPALRLWLYLSPGRERPPFRRSRGRWP